MGKENRYHDKESREIAERHDKLKAKNDNLKRLKEIARQKKYGKPFQNKKDSHALQMELHRLYNTTENNRNHQWKDDWFELRKNCIALKIWDSFVTKYHLASKGYFV